MNLVFHRLGFWPRHESVLQGPETTPSITVLAIGSTSLLFEVSIWYLIYGVKDKETNRTHVASLCRFSSGQRWYIF